MREGHPPHLARKSPFRGNVSRIDPRSGRGHPPKAIASITSRTWAVVKRKGRCYESRFYRILRADGQQHYRGRARPPVERKPPASDKASAPCEVWTWDIPCMPGPVAGIFFYLYLIVAIFSRKIVGWEVQDRAAADLAATLIRQAVLSESCITRPVVLHADNGSPMKGATMKTTVEKPGITPSYSRPRFSNNNPFSEARFRTCKYRPNWPNKGFAAKADAQA